MLKVPSPSLIKWQSLLKMWKYVFFECPLSGPHGWTDTITYQEWNFDIDRVGQTAFFTTDIDDVNWIL